MHNITVAKNVLKRISVDIHTGNSGIYWINVEHGTMVGFWVI